MSITRFIRVIDLCMSVTSPKYSSSSNPIPAINCYHGNMRRSRSVEWRMLVGLFLSLLSVSEHTCKGWPALEWLCVFLLRRRTAEFPLQKDGESGVGYLPLLYPRLPFSCTVLAQWNLKRTWCRLFLPSPTHKSILQKWCQWNFLSEKDDCYIG